MEQKLEVERAVREKDVAVAMMESDKRVLDFITSRGYKGLRDLTEARISELRGETDRRLQTMSLWLDDRKEHTPYYLRDAVWYPQVLSARSDTPTMILSSHKACRMLGTSHAQLAPPPLPVSPSTPPQRKPPTRGLQHPGG